MSSSRKIDARSDYATAQPPELQVPCPQNDRHQHQHQQMSRRTFTRYFRLHTGVSYIEWRQQACLLAAVVMLGKGQPVTQVAMALGYSSSSAFATVFKQLLGEVPSRYLAEQQG